MKKFLRRLGKTRIVMLFFIPFGIFAFYRDSWLGLLAAIIGYSLGCFLCARWNNIKNFPWKKFLRRHLKIIILAVIVIPILSICTYLHGWKGFLASCVGLCIGELISRRIFK